MFITSIVQHNCLGKTVLRDTFREAVDAGIVMHREHATRHLAIGKIREELEDQNCVTLGEGKGMVCVGMVEKNND